MVIHKGMKLIFGKKNSRPTETVVNQVIKVKKSKVLLKY